MTELKGFKPRPFLRWAGGKRQSLNFLTNHLPPDFSSIITYYEPFLGAGSLFFELMPPKAILSDSNKNLIECYQAVQKRPDLIMQYLKEHAEKNCQEYYYEMRSKYNTQRNSISRAALFIYLNKTCFNGLYRVNKEGKFNVPYGFKEPPVLPSKEELENSSLALLNAQLIHGDYKEVVKSANKKDFIYFDPPYPPLSETSCFTRYTTCKFYKDDHVELYTLAKELTSRGCYILISNAGTLEIRNLYENDFNIYELEVMRSIRADGTRYKVKEVAITNYDI